MCSWNSNSAVLGLRCRVGESPLPCKINQTNYNSSPAQTRTFKLCCALLHGNLAERSHPDSALHLTGFQLFRADRITESLGKTRGGGLCFYINEGWCTDVTVLKKMCCPTLEALFINCKPFYSPREFTSFILVSVYIPPDARVSAALELLADQITHTEQRYPDSFIIILGDFNKASLTHALPKYRQHITCPTRDSNILDHCYTVLKDAYHSVPHAALGLSDHCLVHLLPAYR